MLLYVKLQSRVCCSGTPDRGLMVEGNQSVRKILEDNMLCGIQEADAEEIQKHFGIWRYVQCHVVRLRYRQLH